jgi:error-prone DNA polymerase
MDNFYADMAPNTLAVPPRMPPRKTMVDPYGHVIAEIRVKTQDFC